MNFFDLPFQADSEELLLELQLRQDGIAVPGLLRASEAGNTSLESQNA